MFDDRTQDESVIELDDLRALTPDGKISVWTWPDSSLILICGRGIWTPAVLAAHVRVLGDMIATKRMRFTSTRVLIDLRDQGEQSPEVLAEMRAAVDRCYTPADRLAIVVRSSLMKMVARNRFGRDNSEYFVSVDAARTWLNAGV